MQIGNDPYATEFLTKLDDTLTSVECLDKFGNWHSEKRDYIDTTKYDPSKPLTVRRLLKILLGGINKRRDNDQLDIALPTSSSSNSKHHID